MVEKVNVKPGDIVKAGDIFWLYSLPVLSQIVSAKADLVNAQEELRDLLNSGTNLAQAEIDLKDATGSLRKGRSLS